MLRRGTKLLRRIPANALSPRRRNVAMNWSSETFDWDSVGSISMAPCATSGKQTVMEWKPSSIIAFTKSRVHADSREARVVE